MIKRKIVELTGIGFGIENTNQEWERVDAVVSLVEDEDGDTPELEISIGSVTISVPIQDIFDCLKYLGIDLSAWV